MCCVCFSDSVSLASHHARVDRGLLDVAGDAGHKCVPVFEVCVEIGLRRRRVGVKTTDCRDGWKEHLEMKWQGLPGT